MTPHRTRKRMSHYNNVPIGVVLLQKLSGECCPRLVRRRNLWFKVLIFGLTYVAYTCYHMSRKPISVVKSVLQGNCSHSNDTHRGCGYEPFDHADSQSLFGMLDSSFLFSYACAMFISGCIAERVSLRYFLSFGMILSGIFTYLFGFAKVAHIHNLWYFVIIQAFAGIVQTTGWPGVVTLVGRWFGKAKRGLIFGIWNSHTSIGNILGTLIAAQYVETDWGLSFIVPGIIIGGVGFLVFLFVVDSPEIVGCQDLNAASSQHISNDSDIEDSRAHPVYYNAEVSYRPSERSPIPDRSSSFSSRQEQPISFFDALHIPGVIEFALCLFFSKLVSYTFLYWLPLYIQSSSTLSPSLSADLSTLFDVGGIIGAICAGSISDYSGMSATTCTVMLFLASPTLMLYEKYGGVSLSISILLLVIAGILVNGPYALITTSVSAELGQHSSLEGNSRALATVTAIIDGTGSIGAAVGPLLAGVISNNRGWQNVFHMLIVCNVLGMLFLVRLVTKEVSRLRHRINRVRIE